LLELPQQHAVKLVLTTQPPPPRELLEIRPGRQAVIEIGDGLPTEEARHVLSENDEDGILGLRDAPEAILTEACELTGGNPRALEHIVGILRADRHTSLPDILKDTADKLRRDVAQVLLGEAFSRLDQPTQQVVQVLAIYGRRVTVPAVNYLLQPYIPGFDSLPYLIRLVNMRFVRKDREWYYLSQLDAKHALGEVPHGTAMDRTTTADPPPFTQLALFHWAAAYFHETRHNPDAISSIDDLLPQLTEIELLFQGGEYDAAARVLEEIDSRHLLRWGYIRTVHDEHERLRDRLLDPDLSERNLRMLARSLQLLGNNDGAVELYLRALDRARDAGDLKDERKCLNNLGSCYFKLGNTEKAASSYQEALALARRTGQRKGEGRARSGIGLCLARQGKYEEAQTHFANALEIARQTGDSPLECDQLINLGTLYTGFGETDRADEVLGQALWTARKASLRGGEGASLAERAEVLINCGRLEEAIHQARAAVRIAHDIENRELAYSANYVLAVAYLLHGNLNDTRVTAEVAQLGWSTRAHAALGLLGIVALRCGDEDAAIDAFSRAEGLAGTAVEQGRGGFEALDALGLARSGLAACGLAGYVDLALDAYRKARTITSYQGITSRVSMLLNTLLPTGRADLLEIIRPVAAATTLRSGA
jgi:tetratricopeptide (TPR) repeat protein